MEVETKTPVQDQLLRHVRFNEQEPDYVSTWRKNAYQQLNRLSVPTSKTEYYKYTRLAPLFKQDFKPKAPSNSIAANWKRTGVAAELVFVDGEYRADLSTEVNSAEVIAKPISKAFLENEAAIGQNWGRAVLRENQFVDELVHAGFENGFFLETAKNSRLNQPVHIVFVQNQGNALSLYRNLIKVNAGAELDIVITEVSEQTASGLTISLTESLVEENANLNLSTLQNNGNETSSIHSYYHKQEKDSVFTQNQLTFGGKLVRNNIDVTHAGQNIQTNLYGISSAQGSQHIDQHSHIDHAMPNCESNELFKGIFNHRATGVFNGKVTVRQDAQKTNAFQSNQNLLLSDTAKSNSKPELEIYADDVKCSHGSTTGQLDKDALFYLQARGIPADQARALLVQAFLQEVTEQISDEVLLQIVETLIQERYKQA